ncbi:hypothetical protein B0H66DRAFT_81253 [Apodospora peruviana]|uniref:Uncharacterized protein n=1 Tax=Apodospora peruviana TaxID=516989 RepID=A0AAE0MGK9_9PEZI|nr:hypothetical protein B0H66DRAFT_81253 [Apodospora peruviana]
MSTVYKRVYTVCGHGRQETVCPASELRGGQKDGLLTSCARWYKRLNDRPRTEFVYGFCRHCRNWYQLEKRVDVDMLSVVLNYWSFKNRMNWPEPVSAAQIPESEIFGRPAPIMQHAMTNRLELVMLGNQLASRPSVRTGELMDRLENVRTKTLEWTAWFKPPLSPPARPPNLASIREPSKPTTTEYMAELETSSGGEGPGAGSQAELPETDKSLVYEDELDRPSPRVHEPTLLQLCGGKHSES